MNRNYLGQAQAEAAEQRERSAWFLCATMNALSPKGVEKSKEIAREYFARVREMARKGEIG